MDGTMLHCSGNNKRHPENKMGAIDSFFIPFGMFIHGFHSTHTTDYPWLSRKTFGKKKFGCINRIVSFNKILYL